MYIDYSKDSPRGFRNPQKRSLQFCVMLQMILFLFYMLLFSDPITISILALQLPLISMAV